MRNCHDSTSDGQAFLFVNKSLDSKSLSRSERGIAKLINRHAQRVQNRKSENRRIQSLKTNASSARRIALDGWNRKETSTQGSSGSDQETPSSPATDSSSGLTPTDAPFHVTTRSNQCSYGTSTSSPAAFSVVQSHYGPRMRTPSSDDRCGDHQVPLDHGYGHVDENSSSDEDAEALILSATVHRTSFSPKVGMDSFGAGNIHITSSIHSVLQHLLQIYAYSGNNYKIAHLPIQLQKSMPQFPIQTVVQRSVYKEHHLYSLIAAATARMKHVWYEGSPAGDPREVYRIAVRHLRKELLDNARTGMVDKQTLMDLVFIIVSETQYGLFDEARKHLQVIARLHHLLDPNIYLDHWISESTAHVDNQLALMTGQPPVLPFDFDPGPMLPERLNMLKREARRVLTYGYPSPTTHLMAHHPPQKFNDVMQNLSRTLDHRMGTKLSGGIRAGVFAGHFGKSVADLVDCIEIAKVVWLSPIAVCFDAEWLCRKARSVLRSLLAMSPALDPASYARPMSLYTKCTEALRQTIILMLTYACTVIGHQTAQANVVKFRDACAEAFTYWTPSVSWSLDCGSNDPFRKLTPFEHTQAGLALWSVLIGVWVATDCPREEEWFLTRAVNLCTYFGYKTYDDLNAHMSQYMYSRTLQEASIRRAVHAIQARIQV
ncbi:hypothetical protein B0A52_09802 [Exophiala mesophila]|uniref:Transcription factor domain-containing protein n=1 Tax=Exophiala mesophila TaxID=212818 RepID=A0A438MSA4_EXOME|nr:hypothetical protein B0A52_09802 [Exophiala mesophila]